RRLFSLRCGGGTGPARRVPPPPFWGGRGGEGAYRRQSCCMPPSLSLQPKSDISDFGQLIRGRTRVNPSSAASGGGEQTESSAQLGMSANARAALHRELGGDRRRQPVGGKAEVGENHLRGVVGGKPGDVAAGVRA